jgi:hypothetical protein
MKAIIVAATTSILAAASPASAQVAAAESPRVVANQFLVAMRDANWGAMASLMHPSALQELRGILAPLFESAGGGQLRMALLGVATVDEAKALSDSAAFSNFIRASTQQQAGLQEALRSAELQFLGEIPEGGDTVHVVYRMVMTVEDIRVTRMDVMSLARAPAGWRGLLKGDLSALGAALRRAGAGRE